MSDLSDPKKYSFLLDEARANRMGEEARLAFESFDAELRKYLAARGDSSEKWNQFWVGLALRLRECDGVQTWGSLNEGAVRLLAAGLASQMTLARQASAYGVIDPVRATSALESSNESFPKLPYWKRRASPTRSTSRRCTGHKPKTPSKRSTPCAPASRSRASIRLRAG
jgi:hypothetical protein